MLESLWKESIIEERRGTKDVHIIKIRNLEESVLLSQRNLESLDHLEMLEKFSDDICAENSFSNLSPQNSLTQTQEASDFSLLLPKQQSALPYWYDKSSPQYTVGVNLEYLRKKMLTNSYITRELACYIDPNGQAQVGVGQTEPLYPWIQREMLQGNADVVLLQGLAGAGKSTFNRFLLRKLLENIAWQMYRPGDPLPEAPFPVFIPLQSSQVDPCHLWDYFRHMDEISFTNDEIKILQSDYAMIWIADGYDEMSGFVAPNLYDSNNLVAYKIKLVVGCRSQRVQNLKEVDSFVPHGRGGIPEWMRYRMRYLSPFTSQQTEEYIEKYVLQHTNDSESPKDWDAGRYQRELKLLPNLQALIDTPFMLWMTLSILPQLIEKDKNPNCF